MIDYSCDSLSRRTTETRYDDITDADAEQNVRKTYTTTYDEAGRVASVGDGEYDFEYTYSILGLPTSTTQDLAGLSDDVTCADYNLTWNAGSQLAAFAHAHPLNERLSLGRLPGIKIPISYQSESVSGWYHG